MKRSDATELNEKMEAHLDEIYDAADALFTLLNPGYEHDMALCGEVVEMAEKVLVQNHKSACHPYLTDDVPRCDFDKDKSGKLCCGCETCRCS